MMRNIRPVSTLRTPLSYLFSPLDFASLAGDRTSVDYEFQIGARRARSAKKRLGSR